MHPSEAILAAFVVVTLIATALPNGTRRAIGHVLVAMLAVAIGASYVIDGSRWQTVPLVAIAAVLIVIHIVRTATGTYDRALVTRRWLRVLIASGTALVLFVALALPILLPVVDLPAPSGPYAVGTTSYRLVDDSRHELFGEDASAPREIGVVAWYPANPKPGARRATYWDRDGVIGAAYSEHSGMGSFWYTHLRRVRTNGYPNAAVAPNESAYPVVIYSPSFFGLARENTALMEEIASHGYVVYAIDHTYESLITLFPDGETRLGAWDRIASRYDAHAEQELELYQRFDASDSDAERRAILEQIFVVDEQSNALLRVRTADVGFLIDTLERRRGDPESIESNVDTTRIAVAGWSFGGATAEEAALADARVRAVINLDGWPYGERFAARRPITRPYLRLESAADDRMESLVSDIIFDRVDAPAWFVGIRGVAHENFWDFPRFFPIYARLGYWMPYDSDRLLQIERTFVLDFLDEYLMGGAPRDPVVDADSYPELTVRVKNE